MKMAFEALRRVFRPWSHQSVLYEVTTRCNLRCAHCYNVWKDDVGYGEDELPTAKALQLIDKAIRDSKCRQFTFTGGEPLVRDDLERLVRQAKKRCDYIVLITNGTLLSQERVKALVDAGVSLFELPLNSSDRSVHNRMAGGIDSFDKVTKAAAEIRYHGGELAFVFVGTSLNIDGWRDALELGMALGAGTFLYNRYNAGGQCHDKPEALMPSVDQVRAGLRVAEEYTRRYGVGIGASIAIPPCLIDPKEFPHVGFGFCAAGTDRAYYTIDPMGNVRPCNHTPTIIGNLFDKSLLEMAGAQELRDFMAARPSFCDGCELENECLGGCKAAAQVCYGSLTACDPFVKLNQDRAEKGAVASRSS